MTAAGGAASVEAPAARWYAVWTRSQCEPKVEEGLRQRAFEVFLPRIRVPSRRRDRRVVLEQPLFPGYLFLRFVPSREAYVRATTADGLVRILGERWDRLHPIPDGQVESVRRLVTGANDARAVPWIHVGDRVRVVAGPLAGMEGFVREWRARRATFVVGIDLLRRGVGVEIDASILQRAA